MEVDQGALDWFGDEGEEEGDVGDCRGVACRPRVSLDVSGQRGTERCRTCLRLPITTGLRASRFERA